MFELSCYTKVNKVRRLVYWVAGMIAGMIASSFSSRAKIVNCIVLHSYQLVPTK